MPESLRKLTWPLAALAVLLLFNALLNPEFFSLHFAEGRLTGSLVDVLDRATPVLLLSLGMTLVMDFRLNTCKVRFPSRLCIH